MIIKITELKDEFYREVLKELPEIEKIHATPSELLAVTRLSLFNITQALMNNKYVDIGFAILFSMHSNFKSIKNAKIKRIASIIASAIKKQAFRFSSLKS